MARPGVTEEQVRQAIAELEAEGFTPSVQTVRTKLGTGSFSTIQGAIERWRAERAEQTTVTPEVPPRVLALSKVVWAEAWRTADDKFQAQKKALTEEHQRFDTQRRELTVEISRVEGELAATQEVADKNTVELKALTEEFQAARLSLARAEAKLDAAEAAADRARGECQELHKQLAEWVERATRAETKLSKPKAG